jgi:hypothetical protein
VKINEHLHRLQKLIHSEAATTKDVHASLLDRVEEDLSTRTNPQNPQDSYERFTITKMRGLRKAIRSRWEIDK